MIFVVSIILKTLIPPGLLTSLRGKGVALKKDMSEFIESLGKRYPPNF